MPAMVPSIWPVLRLTLVMVADWPGTVVVQCLPDRIRTTTVMSTVPLLPVVGGDDDGGGLGCRGVAALWRVGGSR